MGFFHCNSIVHGCSVLKTQFIHDRINLLVDFGDQIRPLTSRISRTGKVHRGVEREFRCLTLILIIWTAITWAAIKYSPQDLVPPMA